MSSPVKKKLKVEKKSNKKSDKSSDIQAQKNRRRKNAREKEEREEDVWKWWQEQDYDNDVKWMTLEHNGPFFPPCYHRVPKNYKFYYNGKPMKLSEEAEEVAGFYGMMLEHEYTSKVKFNENFFEDWRSVMTPKERGIIKDLNKCNFDDFYDYYTMKSEEKKAMSKEQKQELKQENEIISEEYGYCLVDGHRQKIGNYKIEPPGLFRGRGDHPKMGRLKKRVQPEDIIINIGRDAKIPRPPVGHTWKEVRHDNTVTWLCSWTENILGLRKYVMLNPSSKIKSEKDWEKFELARSLNNHISRIRKLYTTDFKSKDIQIIQRAVALYFIDKLALRTGNEKDEDTADTVGCCSLRVEHIKLLKENERKYIVQLDFLGKDSIRYKNSVAIDKKVFEVLQFLMKRKKPKDELFDELNTASLNKYLNELMEGLTAKVFRTFNASKTLQDELNILTKREMSAVEKLSRYNKANGTVAKLCNHRRAISKSHDKSMQNMKIKIDNKIYQIKECEDDIEDLKEEWKETKSAKYKERILKKENRLIQLEDQLKKLEVHAIDKEENKYIALGTSKMNYLDPRITVAWCKKWDIPIERIYNCTQRDKFRWAIEMARSDFKF